MTANFDFEEHRTTIIRYASSLMPERLRSACKNYLQAYKDIYEIRMRLDAPLSFSISCGNLITGLICSRQDIQFVIDRMSDGSYFKIEEIMRSGLVSLPYGIRCGVCGDVFVSGGLVKTLRSAEYLNIRIPTAIITDCSYALEYIKSSDYLTSLLVISPPGNGKTTLLRSLIYNLSSPPHSKRVSVIDTNREFYIKGHNSGLADFLSGYPKSYGIGLAIRYMAPEYLVCDELGSSEEAEVISELHHTGVPLIASVHADSFSDLKYKKNIKIMLENGVFDTVLRIKRRGSVFEHEIKKVTDI